MGKFSGTGFNYNEEAVTDNRTMEDILLGANPVGEAVVSATDNLAINTAAVPIPATTAPEPISPMAGQDEEGNSFEMQADMSAEQQEQATLDQQELERSYAMHQSVDVDRDTISDVVGTEHSGHFTDGMVQLAGLETDDVGLSYKMSSRLEEFRVMNGGIQAPNVDSERDNYVDASKTRRLSSPQLFSFMDAVETSGDSRGLKVKPMFKVLSLAVVESKLAEIFQAEALMPPSLMENFSRTDASDIMGVPETDLPSMEGESALGKMIGEEWAKIVQRDQMGSDVNIDAHLDPDKKLTKEAQEQLGLWAKQNYAMAYPQLFHKASTVNKAGKSRDDYVLTPDGQKRMEEKKYFMMRKGPIVRPQVTSGDNSNSDNVPFSNLTGKHYRGPLKPADGLVNEHIAQSRLAAVQHMGTEVRMKTGMLFGILALGKAKSYQMIDNKVVLSVDAEGQPISADAGAIDMLSLGQEAVDGINNAGNNALLRVEAIDIELEELSPNSPKYPTLLEKRKALSHFAEVANAEPVGSSRSWRENMYVRRMTQQLAMVQDIAEFHETAIRFPNYVQSGSGRISYKPTVMNPQTHKFARQMYGSATKYSVKPGSNSNAEKAMLLTMGSHLFADGWSTPATAYMNMRVRVQNNDPKLLAIAAVGRKMKGLLAQYDVKPSVEALKAMGTTPENVVQGTEKVFSTIKMDSLEPDVKLFLQESFKHPDEFLHLVEEAIELGNYMDSVKQGNKPFTSTMATVEVDGIQNGVAAVGLQLGIKDIMYRVGVLSENPAKVIAEYKNIVGTLRDVFADNMRSRLPEIMASESFMLDHGSIEPETVEMFLNEAIKNSKEFLKPPIMTFIYGQAIESMGGTMLKTITTSPLLTKMIEETPNVSKTEVARMLHKIVADGLTTTLDSDVIDFSNSLKDLTLVSMSANEELRYQRPTGSWTSLNSTQWETDYNRKAVISSVKNKSDKQLARMEYQPTSREMTAISPEGSSRSSMTSAALAQVTMATDGAAVTNLLSGNMYTHIQKVTGQQVPYVVAIYDAIKGDLGSLIPLLEGINRVWEQSILQYDLLNNVYEGALDSQKRGLAKLTKAAEGEAGGQPAVDSLQAKFLSDYVSRMINDDSFETRFMNGMSKVGLSAFKQQYYSLGKDSEFTNSEVLALFKMITPLMNVKLRNFKKVAADAKDRRDQLAKDINGGKINQYHPDFLKSFNFHTPSVAPVGGRT